MEGSSFDICSPRGMDFSVKTNEFSGSLCKNRGLSLAETQSSNRLNSSELIAISRRRYWAQETTTRRSRRRCKKATRHPLKCSKDKAPSIDEISICIDSTLRVIDSWMNWRQLEEEMKLMANIPTQKVHPYIDFKLNSDLWTSPDSTVVTIDPVAIDYFLGDFLYSQAKAGYNQCSIVLLIRSEKFYFGSTATLQEKMKVNNVEIDSLSTEFEGFITFLERKVFMCKLLALDEPNKRCLSVILRLLCQNENSVAVRTLCGYLKARAGYSDRMILVQKDS